MPEGPIQMPGGSTPSGLSLHDLEVGKPDAIGADVKEIGFRGRDYAVYRAERGIYVQFSDDKVIEQAQRSAYVKLSVQICELRYLTSQMRRGILGSPPAGSERQETLYDHNMGQALMLLTESAAQRSINQLAEANVTEQEAKDIAQRALDMAVRGIAKLIGAGARTVGRRG
jgi:hypothetical protein